MRQPAVGEQCGRTDRLHERFRLLLLLERVETRKPEEECYRRVLAELGCDRAESVVFFDDSPACVEGARRIGMQAFVVRGAAGVRNALATLG
jgi:HAD superfamily hydrolase (TIGR01509 family)